MNSKAKTAIQLVFILSAIAIVMVAIGFVIGKAFEPIDPFPRADRMTKCTNNASVVLYQRKVGWFTEEAEWSVKQFDQHGTLMRRQVLFTLPHWNDSEMHRTPEEFCDDKYWTRTKQAFLPAAQPNKSAREPRERVSQDALLVQGGRYRAAA